MPRPRAMRCQRPYSAFRWLAAWDQRSWWPQAVRRAALGAASDSSGRVVVVLTGLRTEYEAREVEIEPRLLELPTGEYGLIELIQRHGQPDGDAWRVVLTRDVHQIVGLADEPSDTLAVSFSIRFDPPEDGLPAPMPWPEPDALAGEKPQAPAPDLADKQ